jgi:alpha-glucosidase
MTPSWLKTVHHDGSEVFLSNPYPQLGEQIRIRLRTGIDAPVRGVFLRTAPDGEQFFTPLAAGLAEAPVQWWEGNLSVDQPVLHYRFLIDAQDGSWWYSAEGPQTFEPLDYTDFTLLADYHPPAWLQGAVFYQILPDRFANGDPSNDPQPAEYEIHGHRPRTFPWGAPPPDDQPFSLVFYGGDLQGVLRRLDHLDQLGVNALYLNPIFTAYSNHKYDVLDYDHVDPHLGGDEALMALRQALDDRGMRYVLDIVPNHCGYWHPWFQTARQDPDAVEAEFFTFKRRPDDYATWLGVWSLPKLNYRSQELRRRMYAGPDAVFRKWLRSPFRADGWRVDVANMLGRQGADQLGLQVAHELRAAVKATRPDAYLLGEHFFDASFQLQGDQWDGVMNYAGFTFPLWHWLRGYEMKSHGMKGPVRSPVPWPTESLAGAWRNRMAAIPWAVALQQYNLLDSHDLPRIRSIVRGNDALHRLAVVILLTFPGVPGLYYGDEIGMSDSPGLQSRGCLVWEESGWDHELLAFHRDMISLRRRSTVLQKGGFQMLAIEADTFAYQRTGFEGRVLVVAHRGQEPRLPGPLPVAHGGIPDGSVFGEHFTGQERVVQDGTLSLPEHPQGASVWVQK